MKKQKDKCRVFMLCKNKATTSVKNAILGDVASCQRCADKMAKIDGK